MLKRNVSTLAFPSSADSGAKENLRPVASLEEYNTDNKGQVDVLVTKAVSYGAVQAVTMPFDVFGPVFPNLLPESSTVVALVTPQDAEVNPLAFNAEGVRAESSNDTNGRLGLASPKREKTSRWIKHTLPSGLVIEVEATRSSSLMPRLTGTTNQPALHSPTQTFVRRRSPEPPYDRESYFQNDASVEFTYSHLEDWLLESPRQGGDAFFEEYRQELIAQRGLPFHQRHLWQRSFIPTLLKFLGTQTDPWKWSGDAFLSLLPAIWSTVYGNSLWPDEDSALVHSLATDSVLAWFESFAFDALVSVEKFLKDSTDGAPSLSKWSDICEEMMRDGHMFDERPDDLGCSGLFRSMFVLAPLSNHLGTIRGGIRIEGFESSYDNLDRPFGAIGLAAAAAFRAAMLFRVQLIGYNEDGKLFVKTPTGDDDESPIIDTSFSKHTAGSITRRRASLACDLLSDELDTILLRAHELALYKDEEIFNPDSRILNSDDGVLNSDDGVLNSDNGVLNSDDGVLNSDDGVLNSDDE